MMPTAFPESVSTTTTQPIFSLTRESTTERNLSSGHAVTHLQAGIMKEATEGMCAAPLSEGSRRRCWGRLTSGRGLARPEVKRRNRVASPCLGVDSPEDSISAGVHCQLANTNTTARNGSPPFSRHEAAIGSGWSEVSPPPAIDEWCVGDSGRGWNATCVESSSAAAGSSLPSAAAPSPSTPPSSPSTPPSSPSTPAPPTPTEPTTTRPISNGTDAGCALPSNAAATHALTCSGRWFASTEVTAERDADA